MLFKAKRNKAKKFGAAFAPPKQEECVMSTTNPCSVRLVVIVASSYTDNRKKAPTCQPNKQNFGPGFCNPDSA